MSRILESAIGTEREAACRCNDDALAHNAPIAPITTTAAPRPRTVALSRTTVFHARLAMIKIALCCAMLGFAAGQWAQRLERSEYPMHFIKPNARDLHKLPGTNTVPALPHKVV
jgi:hypothetical protein